MNEEGIRFTVAISTYNVEKYVERAVKSVTNQEFNNFENCCPENNLYAMLLSDK